ncbi:MAG: adenylate kinase [Thermoplasmatota archaeon]
MGAIIVTGIPGVGKTTVMEAAAEHADRTIVVYGTVMFEVASERGLVEHRDDMRKLEPAVQKEVQKAAAAKMAEMGDIIVDTHCTIKTPKGFLPGLPAWVLEALMPEAIILVEADAAEIQGRRADDATRVRDADSIEAIEQHQEFNRRFSAAYATLTGATVHTVYNHDNKVDEAIEQILPVVGQVIA